MGQQRPSGAHSDVFEGGHLRFETDRTGQIVETDRPHKRRFRLRLHVPPDDEGDVARRVIPSTIDAAEFEKWQEKIMEDGLLWIVSCGLPDQTVMAHAARFTLIIRPVAPFRPDLTVWALRRRERNAIDRWAARRIDALW
jgi:hypothetical protein